MLEKTKRATSKPVEDDEIVGGGNNKDNNDKDKLKPDPDESIDELRAKIASLENINKRLVTQNELITDALTACKNKDEGKINIDYKVKLSALINLLQEDIMKLRNYVDEN